MMEATRTQDGKLTVSLDSPVENYTNVSKIAKMTGNDLRWVARAMRSLGIKPTATLGERQLGREAVVRLCLLATLQKTLGPTSPTPWIMVKAADDAIADLLREPSNATVVAIRSGHDVVISVAVPNLDGLLAVAS